MHLINPDQTVTKDIIGAAITVHKELGPGLLESVYAECLTLELKERDIYCEREVLVPVIYKELKLDRGYRIDLLVERTIVIELKVVEELTKVHEAQILTYLNLGNYPLGLLINFNTRLLKDGIKRFKL